MGSDAESPRELTKAALERQGGDGKVAFSVLISFKLAPHLYKGKKITQAAKLVLPFDIAIHFVRNNQSVIILIQQLQFLLSASHTVPL